MPVSLVDAVAVVGLGHFGEDLLEAIVGWLGNGSALGRGIEGD